MPVSEYYIRRHEYFMVNSNVNPDCTFAQLEILLPALVAEKKKRSKKE